jgi:hypothetical protein
MGMFDVVVFDAGLPECPVRGRRFQTKSLDCCMDIYTVTSDGRLCLTGSDLLEASEALREVDIDFHGDIRLLAESGGEEYVARFTHGALEWVRPMADMPTPQLPPLKSSPRKG